MTRKTIYHGYKHSPSALDPFRVTPRSVGRVVYHEDGSVFRATTYVQTPRGRRADTEWYPEGQKFFDKKQEDEIVTKAVKNTVKPKPSIFKIIWDFIKSLFGKNK